MDELAITSAPNRPVPMDQPAVTASNPPMDQPAVTTSNPPAAVRDEPAPAETRRYHFRGVVQGVGFRPFVLRLAERHRLGGWVCNDPDGAVLEVQGPVRALEAFILQLRAEPPALARIDGVALLHCHPVERPLARFEIRHSDRGRPAGALISPDAPVCADCLRELLDPADRRYRYPFINCTNCGPRYSIVRGVPYDRERTTMAAFPMCARCAREYRDVHDRRFHAQPIACWECGPRVALLRAGEGLPADWGRPMSRLDADWGRPAPRHAGWSDDPAAGPRDRFAGFGARRPGRGEPPHAPDPVAGAIALLRAGAILAVKGIGGYHLMANARDERAVARLRRRKRREAKPFAVMSATLQAVRGYARVREREAELLGAGERPIVLVRKRAGGLLASAVAPENRCYGVMLAYTPLQHLLLRDGLDALVATSGNTSEEPIAFLDDDAIDRLAGIADAFLVGEREIFTRVDDSIVRVVGLGEATGRGGRAARGDMAAGGDAALRGETAARGGSAHGRAVCALRRARGYAPAPVRAPFRSPPLLAVGPELKSTVCLSRGADLFLSHHIGDLKNAATLRSFEHAIEHLRRLLEVAPRAIAHDMHPGYLSTRYALAQRELPTVAVQHHHAHMAACMCEHGLTEPVIGVVFDGAGYGSDGHIWGGEILVGDYAGFERAAHLRYFRLPGGDRAVHEPYRVALALLHHAGIALADVDLPVVRERDPDELRVLGRMLDGGLSSPLTSSMGRLFDGVAALIGCRQRCRYEAQAAIELEQLIEPGARARPFAWDLHRAQGWPWTIDTTPLVAELACQAAGRRASAGELSLRFHCTVLDIVRATCSAVRERTGIARAVLSGGVFQNEFLLHGCHRALREAGFEVHIHRDVPANDGGVALGQAAVAGWSAA
ncbi:MAG TPA: Sua5/YciO/YrdC/YwlC family protein [Solirubrobacteraceae bacterium]|nr:Sua5/YciO/YrdC/YwlC family protein [Solirubrobacteraceae bacterium]